MLCAIGTRRVDFPAVRRQRMRHECIAHDIPRIRHETDSTEEAVFRRACIRCGTQLDFIEKCAASAADEAVKDGFITEHVIGTLEGEPEWSEVTERAPASPHVGPVEQLEAI